MVTMDPGTKDRLIRNITIAATALTAAILLSADYGPNPHVFSSVSNSIRGLKNWFWTPSQGEQEEYLRRVSQGKPSSSAPQAPSRDAEKQ